MIPDQARRLIHKYGGAVPRYTSYPTAVQFHDRFTDQDMKSCLMTINGRKPVSIYIHIPFCHSLCHYCGCHTKIVNHANVISAYVDTLCQEIRIAAACVPEGATVSRLHFGGGSPNYAPMADIKKIVDTVRTIFDCSVDMQIDMECDPRLLSDEKIMDMARIGIGRVSLGIQDFDENVQKSVNRIQSPEHVRKQVDSLMGAGIHDINFDLIVGLPEQTRDSVRRTAMETMNMMPSRIAVFSYAHVPWKKPHQRLLDKYHFPSPEDRFLMQDDIKDILHRAGYNSIGIDHYALPGNDLSRARDTGEIQRNFQGYTDDPASVILGFGLSAISQFESAYAQNKLDAVSYRRAVEEGRLPVGKGLFLDEGDLAARKAIMQIMCHFHLDMREHQIPPNALASLTMLENDGIIERFDDTIRITDAGRPFTRVVASCFDSYFQDDNYKKENRHAKAI